MTSLPAEIFEIPQRGRIAEGYFADLVLIDPDKVCSSAQFTNPHQKAEGIEKVWVNGQLAYNNKDISKNRAGEFIAF